MVTTVEGSAADQTAQLSNVDYMPPLAEAVPLGIPKLGALISTIPNAVLGGAVVIMFGLITSAGMKMLHAVTFNKRNMIIIGVSLAVAIGLRLQEGLYEGAPDGLKAILHSGLIPGAVVSIVLNLILPEGEEEA
jgi:NCS2 family nucleobase:cation symporter-2